MIGLIKKKNKKITIIVLVLIFVVSLPFMFLTVLSKLSLPLAEHKFDSNPTKQNIFNVCNLLVGDENHSKIIEYYSIMLEEYDIVDVITQSDIINSELQEDDSSSYDGYVDLYVVQYLNAIYEEKGEEAFLSELTKYQNYLKLGKIDKNNSCELFKVIQSYFPYKYSSNTSKINEKKVEFCLQLISKQLDEKEYTVYEEILFYEFLKIWYGEIGCQKEFDFYRLKLNEANKEVDSDKFSSFDLRDFKTESEMYKVDIQMAKIEVSEDAIERAKVLWLDTPHFENLEYETAYNKLNEIQYYVAFDEINSCWHVKGVHNKSEPSFEMHTLICSNGKVVAVWESN